MAESGYLLTQDDGNRIAQVVLDYESGKLSNRTPNQPQEANSSAAQTIVVQITGAISSGLYPADSVYYDGSAWQTYNSAIRVLELNAYALASGKRYFARFIGPVTVSGSVYGLFGVWSPGEVVTNITCTSGVLTVTKRVV
jgi:hypothetical protein